jgi:hypothetical protein
MAVVKIAGMAVAGIDLKPPAGSVDERAMPVGPPSASANTTVRSDPAASSTARTSSAHSSQVGMALSGTASDAPVPRRSKRISLP